jgi:hypothetical protein
MDFTGCTAAHENILLQARFGIFISFSSISSPIISTVVMIVKLFIPFHAHGFFETNKIPENQG